MISGLEERGFIRRLAHRARALEVIKLPEESAAPGSAAGSDWNPAGWRLATGSGLAGGPDAGSAVAAV